MLSIIFLDDTSDFGKCRNQEYSPKEAKKYISPVPKNASVNEINATDGKLNIDFSSVYYNQVNDVQPLCLCYGCYTCNI